MENYNNLFPSAELNKINEADDLKIAPLRNDGKTYGTPTWIWDVVVDGQLYVRAYNGPRSKWYRSAIANTYGQIHAAGKVWEVEFTAVREEALNLKIDKAYSAKYSQSPYLKPMLGKGPREATIRINPKNA